ncbi:MAG: hypothetical protein LBO65_06875 [Spirochaetaceae bacterium]|jgi:hypothetical protein|nr:hypothetical protein [Spirochaetaceae bacterium]
MSNTRVYKFVSAKNLFVHLEEYLAGKLYFAEWKTFADKEEGKYYYSDKPRNEEILRILYKEKHRCFICSTAKCGTIFELWARALLKPPAICLGLDIDAGKEIFKWFQADGQTGQDNPFSTNWEGNELNACETISVDIDYKPKPLELTYDKILNDGTAKSALRILSTKLQHYAFEEELRFIKYSGCAKAKMYPVGELKEIFIAGYCKRDCWVQALEEKVLERNKNQNTAPIEIKYVYVDPNSEKVDVFGNINCPMVCVLNGNTGGSHAR